MKKFLFYFSLSFIVYFLFINNIFALDIPVSCQWLPWCDAYASSWVNETKIFTFIWRITSEFIKYIAVFSVIALMLAWLNFVVWWGLSWEEEKVKKAKNWVLWALVWVILSVSAWWIINVLNNLQIVN